MHTRIGDIEPALDVLGRYWSGPKLAYAETGKYEMPDWNFEQICDPGRYGDVVRSWIEDHGV